MALASHPAPAPILSIVSHTLRAYSIFRIYRHTPRTEQFTSTDGSDRIFHPVRLGPRLPRQNHLYRSGVGAPHGRSHGRTGLEPDQICALRHLSHLQTPKMPPLPDLRPLYMRNGPPLSLDEQLYRNRQPQTLYSLFTLRMDASGLLLVVFAVNYFFCATEECVFTPVLVQLVRVMSFLSVGALLFTSNMIANVTWGIMTGTGTIDRMKRTENNTVWDSDEESIPLTDVFGIGGWYTWPFPIDPLFDDYDRVMGYSSTQRLLREKTMREDSTSSVNSSMGNAGGCFENA